MADPMKETKNIDERLLGEIISREECRQVQLEMVDALAEACEAHGLTYYMAGGTLLGAVRHKGFIPWDDDVDICMTRSDVDRLLELTGGRLNDHTVIASPGGIYPTVFDYPRIYDTRYILIHNSRDIDNRVYSNLLIDIFPVEGLPTNLNLAKLHYWAAEVLITLRRMAYYPVVRSKGALRQAAKRALQPLAKLFGAGFWDRRLQNLAKMYRYEDGKYVGVVTGDKYRIKERVLQEDYGTPVKMEFEGRQYNAPAGWDAYLTNHYGDYMKLPPKEEQKSHNFIVYRVKDVQS